MWVHFKCLCVGCLSRLAHEHNRLLWYSSEHLKSKRYRFTGHVVDDCRLRRVEWDKLTSFCCSRWLFLASSSSRAASTFLISSISSRSSSFINSSRACKTEKLQIQQSTEEKQPIIMSKQWYPCLNWKRPFDSTYYDILFSLSLCFFIKPFVF